MSALPEGSAGRLRSMPEQLATPQQAVRRLFVISAGGDSAALASEFIPSLKDISGTTGLTQETVSRVISQLRRVGILTRQTRSQLSPCMLPIRCHYALPDSKLTIPRKLP